MTKGLLGNIEYRNGSSSEEIFICCPHCLRSRGVEDTKYKMGVNLNTGVFNCFKCRATNRTHDLKILAGLEFQGENYSDLDDIQQNIRTLFEKKETKLDLTEFSVPVDEEETPMAYLYLTEGRGFSESVIKKNDIRVGKSFPAKTRTGEDYTNRKWLGRIIFPFFENKECKFAVGRTHVDHEVKYYNSLGGKGKYIYGLDKVQGGMAILCEGIISSIAAERHSNVSGISTLGKFATEIQMTKIRTKVDTLYLCLDGDVSERDRVRLRDQARSFKFKKVFEVFLPQDCDPDDMNKEEFMIRFMKAPLIFGSVTYFEGSTGS